MSLNWIVAMLPWLLVLACPLGMYWMMRGMRGGKGDGCGPADKRADGRDDPRDAEIRALKARLAESETRDRHGGAA